MKKLLSILLLLFTSLGYQAQAQCPTLIWADEFDGNTLDLSKWEVQTGDGCAEGICGWGNSELQSYSADNITVNNGIMTITAKKERTRGSQYTSGRIRTINKGDWTYGRFEARIKIPAGAGLWPAFWMLPTDEVYGGWPTSGEIDIMECVGASPETVFGTIHYGDAWPNNQHQGNEIHKTDGTTFADDFHVYTVEWENGEIRWMLDDMLYSRKTAADIAPALWPFDQDFHFLLNLAVGGSLGGDVDDSMLPNGMEVDYVRVYSGSKPYLEGSTVALYQEQGATYSVGNVANNANVTWSVPADATIVSGQGSSSITVNFGSTSGDVTAVVDNGCTAQTIKIPVDVEPPFAKEFAFENFDDAGTVTFNTNTTGTLSEVANPSSDAVNSSALSGMYTRDAASQYDLLIYDAPSIDGADYVNKAKKFSLDVYTSAPVGTPIILQLETPDATPSNYPVGRHSRFIGTTTTTNGWERITFSILDRPDPSASGTAVSTFIFLFASNTFTGDTYYFDNFDSYAVDNGGTGGNTAPSVGITAPSNNTSYTTLETINITADASDSDGSVSSVEFFVDGTSIGVDNAAPYEVSWTIPAFASYAITAVATDNEGGTTTSSTVNITASEGSTGGGGGGKGGGRPKREGIANTDAMAVCYPNPTAGSLFVRLSGFNMESTSVALVDLSGRTVMTRSGADAQNGIATDKLASSTYIVVIQDEQNRIIQRIFVK